MLSTYLAFVPSAEPRARWAQGLIVFGAGVTLPYCGAEVFGELLMSGSALGYRSCMNDEKLDTTQDQRESTPNSAGPEGAAGGMGVSSERVGRTGGDQQRTDGLKDTAAQEAPADGPPEQSAGGAEPQPEGLEPKAGYPKLDPRHEHKPYQP